MLFFFVFVVSIFSRLNIWPEREPHIGQFHVGPARQAVKESLRKSTQIQMQTSEKKVEEAMNNLCTDITCMPCFSQDLKT